MTGQNRGSIFPFRAMNLFRHIASAAAALTLSACAVGSHFEFASMERITPGMNEAQVIEVMGSKPTAISASGNATVLVWSYGNALGEGRSARVVLKDGRVPDDYRPPAITRR